MKDDILKDFDISLENVNLTEIISAEFLQKFQDAFSNALGIASLTTDKNGVPVTNGSNFTDFCMKLSRGSKEGLKRCMESDAFGGAESARTGKPAVYFCGSGLMDFGAPIMINGKQIGSILGGQVLPSAPDKDKFVSIAKEINVDSNEFLDALDKVKIVPKEQLEAAAELLFVVTSEISKMAYQKLVLKKTVEKLHENVMKMTTTMQELTTTATSVTDNQTELNKEIQNVSMISEQINNFTQSIKSISEQSRLLGLNAAIEAAKAGEAGLGFGVVAKEIHKMAIGSKDAVNNINNITSQISDSVFKTLNRSDKTLDITNHQGVAINEISELIGEIASVTDSLNKMASDN